jgi:hypothetical protein
LPRWFALLVLVLLFVPVVAADPEAEIARLVKQLGDDDFDQREAATKRLAEIGEPALDTLRKAAASSNDAEIRARVARLIAAITARLELAQARVDAAHKAYEVAVKMVLAGSPDVTREDVYTWSVRWLNAQRGLGSKHEDHLSALHAHRQRMQAQAKVARARWQAGVGSHLDSLAADYFLMEAEFWLAQVAAAKKADR